MGRARAAPALTVKRQAARDSLGATRVRQGVILAQLSGWVGEWNARWILPAAVIVSVELAFALVAGAIVGFHYELAIEGYFWLGTMVGIAVGWSTTMLRVAAYPFMRVASPLAQLRADSARYGGAIVAFWAGLTLLLMQICLLNWVKSMIPLITSFWADPLIASLDRSILGADAWVLLHAAFPHSARLFDWFYAIWVPCKFGTLLALILMPQSRTKALALLSYFLTVAIGILIGQYMLPSAGPVFYARLGFGDDFAALPVAPFTQAGTDYLWDAYLRGAGKVGGGISAFPSIHVATSAWTAFVWTRWHWLAGLAGWFVAVMICLATVYLGWHYAFDVVGGLALALLAQGLAYWWVDRAVTAANPRRFRILKAFARSSRA